MNTYSSLTDIELLALCLWREARGDGRDGMRAVAHVILNRTHSPNFPHSLRDVILAPAAFSSFLSSDPQSLRFPSPQDPSYLVALDVAQTVGTDPDLTRGAHYYANLHFVTSGWFQRNILENPSQHPLLAVVGEQSFYL